MFCKVKHATHRQELTNIKFKEIKSSSLNIICNWWNHEWTNGMPIVHHLGHIGQLCLHCRALGTTIKNVYHGIQKDIRMFSLKHFAYLLLVCVWGGGNHNLRAGCRRHLANTFKTTARCPQTWRTCTFRGRSPNDDKRLHKVHFLPFSRSHLDVIFLMYQVCSGFPRPQSQWQKLS